MTGTIKLYDGTLVSGTAADDDDILWLSLEGVGFAEAASMLSDPAKTGVITAIIGKTERMYGGFTQLFSLRKDAAGKISAGLEKE